MSVLNRKSRVIPALLIAVVLGLALPITSNAQGWGRGRGNDRWEQNNRWERNRWEGKRWKRDRWERKHRRHDSRFDNRFERYGRTRNWYDNNNYRIQQQRRYRNYRY
jgi:hypothetical protein